MVLQDEQTSLWAYAIGSGYDTPYFGFDISLELLAEESTRLITVNVDEISFYGSVGEVLSARGRAGVRADETYLSYQIDPRVYRLDESTSLCLFGYNGESFGEYVQPALDDFMNDGEVMTEERLLDFAAENDVAAVIMRTEEGGAKPSFHKVLGHRKKREARVA